MRLAVAQYQQILVKLGILMALRCQNWYWLAWALLCSGDCLLPCYACYVIKAREFPRSQMQNQIARWKLPLHTSCWIFLFSTDNGSMGWIGRSARNFVVEILLDYRSIFSCVVRSLLLSLILWVTLNHFKLLVKSPQRKGKKKKLKNNVL